MRSAAYFIRQCVDERAIVKLHPDGHEEIIEQGLTLAEAETLYFICIGEPVHERSIAKIAADDEHQMKHRRSRQLAFKF